MTESRRRTPLEFPREAAYPKRYSSVICADGTLLPIEERLGRRLLRSLPADSREALALLRSGCVSLVDGNGRPLRDRPIADIYESLWKEAKNQLETEATSPDRKASLRAALASIERWRRTLEREH